MNNRRRLTGVVTSNKMEKTVMVMISRTYRHPLYKKVVHSKKKVMAHDELGSEVGDRVKIVESQPISKRKRWVVQEILRRASEAEVAAKQEDDVDELEEVLAELEVGSDDPEEVEVQLEDVSDESKAVEAELEDVPDVVEDIIETVEDDRDEIEEADRDLEDEREDPDEEAVS